jgi:hypothetical protein
MGWCWARSAFHHSMNYRSVMILGVATRGDRRGGERAALAAIVERVLPGRASAVARAGLKELNATTVLSLSIEGGLRQDPHRTAPGCGGGLCAECWAGVLPLKLTALSPVPDPRLPEGIARCPRRSPPGSVARGRGAPSHRSGAR